jgi:UDP-N-acetylglucosamine 2-epimerase (non-hydrolysing)
MIDTLVKLLPKALQRNKLKEFNVEAKEYILVTLHRPSNVDDPTVLRGILQAMVEISEDVPVIFPVHPRTRSRIHDLNESLPKQTLQLVEPLGYLDFLALMNGAKLVVTDSGGIQEETTYLGVPCLTARPNTERPVTLSEGTNRLTGSNCHGLVGAARESLRRPSGSSRKPDLWDGHAAERIVEVLHKM